MTQEEINTLPKIHGWVVWDNRFRLIFYTSRPERKREGEVDYWSGKGSFFLSPLLKQIPNAPKSFEDDPIEVELIIRPL